MILENWLAFPIMNAERPGFQLNGRVYGHPVKDDGTEMITSRVMRIYQEHGRLVAVTRNSEYILPIYEDPEITEPK